MKKEGSIEGRMRLIGLVGLMALVGGCSGELEEPAVQGVVVHLAGLVTPFQEVEEDGANGANEANGANGSYGTRADWLPGGFVEASPNPSLGVFFTKDSPAPFCEERRFWYGSDAQWRMSEEVLEGSYLLYGYAPYNAADASLTTSTTYAGGATLTLTGLSTVMTKDVCAIVGAKDGTAGDTPASPGLQVGQFGCQMHSGEETKNYLFLLLDHLYSAFHFRFRVHEDYAQLRTIKLRRLELTAYTNNTFTTRMKEHLDATVTLQANTTGASPIQSVEFGTAYGNQMQPVIIFDGEETLPSGKDQYGQYIYTDEIGFVPSLGNCYILRSTYDVYDKQENLIRKGCTAENKINPRAILSAETLERGKMYALRLTVTPTYLYVLSEPDLDNPTAEM